MLTPSGATACNAADKALSNTLNIFKSQSQQEKTLHMYIVKCLFYYLQLKCAFYCTLRLFMWTIDHCLIFRKCAGRFAVNTRLCLSMSDFHPESWNPMWSVSCILIGELNYVPAYEHSPFEARQPAALLQAASPTSCGHIPRGCEHLPPTAASAPPESSSPPAPPPCQAVVISAAGQLSWAVALAFRWAAIPDAGTRPRPGGLPTEAPTRAS